MPASSEKRNWLLPVVHYNPSRDPLWYNSVPDYVRAIGPTELNELEEHYNATFLLEYPIRVADFTRMAFLFWSETEHWIPLTYMRATDSKPEPGWIRHKDAELRPIPAIVSKEGQVLFSKGRGDFRTSRDNSYAVDGGPGYERVIGNDLQNLETAILLPQQGELHSIDKSAAALMRGDYEDWRFN